MSPSLEWPPPEDDLSSRIIWDVLGRLAEYELRAIARRNVKTQRAQEAERTEAARTLTLPSSTIMT